MLIHFNAQKIRNIMNRIAYISICLLIILSPVIVAQQVITGRITDAVDGTPVPGASVFIANTTVGTASDTSGNYSLTVPGRGSFEIVVSHVGYQSVFTKLIRHRMLINMMWL